MSRRSTSFTGESRNPRAAPQTPGLRMNGRSAVTAQKRSASSRASS
jgi:hypothetical protein